MDRRGRHTTAQQGRVHHRPARTIRPASGAHLPRQRLPQRDTPSAVHVRTALGHGAASVAHSHLGHLPAGPGTRQAALSRIPRRSTRRYQRRRRARTEGRAMTSPNTLPAVPPSQMKPRQPRHLANHHRTPQRHGVVPRRRAPVAVGHSRRSAATGRDHLPAPQRGRSLRAACALTPTGECPYARTGIADARAQRHRRGTAAGEFRRVARPRGREVDPLASELWQWTSVQTGIGRLRQWPVTGLRWSSRSRSVRGPGARRGTATAATADPQHGGEGSERKARDGLGAGDPPGRHDC